MAEVIKDAPKKPLGVYDNETGEFLPRDPIDCRELVASGGYSYEKPEKLGKKAPVEDPDKVEKFDAPAPHVGSKGKGK